MMRLIAAVRHMMRLIIAADSAAGTAVSPCTRFGPRQRGAGRPPTEAEWRRALGEFGSDRLDRAAKRQDPCSDRCEAFSQPIQAGEDRPPFVDRLAELADALGAVIPGQGRQDARVGRGPADAADNRGRAEQLVVGAERRQAEGPAVGRVFAPGGSRRAR